MALAAQISKPRDTHHTTHPITHPRNTDSEGQQHR